MHKRYDVSVHRYRARLLRMSWVWLPLWALMMWVAGVAQAQPVVSFEASPTTISEEDAPAVITFTFTVDGDIPPPVFDANGVLISGGLPILFENRDINRFFSQVTNVALEGFVVGDFFDTVRFAIELVLLRQTSFVSFEIINDVIEEPDQTFTFGILPDTAGVLRSQYVVNPAASSSTITLTDGRGGPGIGPSVGLTVSQEEVNEGDAFTINFNVNGDLGAERLQVLVGSPRAGAISELAVFDDDGNRTAELNGVSEIEVIGGFSDGGLLITLTQPQASITLRASDDDLYEGAEFYTFQLAEGEVYEIDPTASSDSITIRDTGERPVKPDLSPELTATLDATLDAVRPSGVPGAAAAILSPSGDWFGASGIANIAENRPVQPNDRFEAGSITKTFVATAILQMVEEGRLTLADKLTDWIPASIASIIPHVEDITIKQMLGHTSGVADYLAVLGAQASTNPTIFLRQWRPGELIALIALTDPFFEPGQSWQYSNTNYILAGLVIEAVTGNNYAREIRDRILTPLNLNDTFVAAEEEVPGGYVSGYLDFDGNGTLDDITSLANLTWAGAAGSIVSNTADLAAFFDGLFKGNLLQPATLAQMLETIPVSSPNYDAYGLGIGALISTNRYWYANRGLTLVFRANLWYSPAEDMTYVELINRRSVANMAGVLLPTFRNGLDAQ